MSEPQGTTRTVRVFRFDPEKGGEGHFDTFRLDIPDESTTTILDVLLRIQKEQDPTVAFRYACRVNMCGSCGMVINGREGLACKTNVSHLPEGQEVTLRPLNHFPIIKDLVVDMTPFFKKYEATLPFYDPKMEYAEPVKIRPDSPERQDIGMATECISCGCCVSSCTMCNYHDDYAGPASLNRAFTLLADSRDGLFEARLSRALDSCYNCRTEFNCTEVCPKEISATRAIKYIQRLALKHRQAAPRPAAEAASLTPAPLPPRSPLDRRAFLRQAGIGVLGVGAALALGGVVTGTTIGPALEARPKMWIPAARLSELPVGAISTVMLRYDVKSGIYTQPTTKPLLVSRSGSEIVCFNASCTHLGCIVRWDEQTGRFLCACHGGAFDRAGNVLAGPPPRPLDRYPFKVEADTLLVEVG